MAEKTKKEKIPRQKMPEQKPEVRRRNFEEVPLGFDEETAVREAERCLQCKKPTCMDGCPVSVDIPAFIRLIKEGEFTKSIRSVWERNSLPAVCGRVCPQESQCEGVCILGKKDDPVAIGALERYVADRERNQGSGELPPKAAPTGKRVAVVGCGPSGLTVAGDLILKGHDVTIFEAFHKPGGVLVYGIPEFRLPKEIVYSEVNFLERLGVKVECNVVVGRTVSVDELMEKEGFDAVYVGVGAGLPRFLNIPGENLINVYSANEYLTRANLMKAYLFPEYDTPIAVGKNVAVFGAGNVAMDAARTAMRLGADKVRIIYRRSREEMPARAEEIHHAEEEGIEFHLLTAPTRFLGDNRGWIKGIECLEMELGEPDDSGRRRPVPKEGSKFQLECDLAVIAVGAAANPLLTQSTEALQLNKWGYIIADPETGKTTKPGVWAGGDIVTGQATVILAMGAGRMASDSIHNYLTPFSLLFSASENLLPVVGQLLDGLVDVAHGEVGLALGVAGQLRVPALDQLLDAAHVDVAVVQEPLELRHVLDQEPTVLPDRVAAERRRLGLAEGAQEREGLPLGRAGVVGGGQGPVQEPGGPVVGPAPGLHGLHDVRGVVDGQVGAFGQDAKVAVRDQGGDLQDASPFRVQARHLQVDPDQPFAHLARPFPFLEGAAPRRKWTAVRRSVTGLEPRWPCPPGFLESWRPGPRTLPAGPGPAGAFRDDTRLAPVPPGRSRVAGRGSGAASNAPGCRPPAGGDRP